jgi:hypothetical protein
MDDGMNRPVVVGQVARVELCPCAHSLVLSVGALSLRLELSAAEDVARTIANALVLWAGERPPDNPMTAASNDNAGGSSEETN